MKLFLLDAYALIYRSYYAFINNPRVNSKGLNTSAIFGFVNTLEEVLKKENPSHIGVVFDPKGKTFRHDMYEPYKANREKTPEDIQLAIPIIKDIIEAYNIPVIEVPHYEADDVIGTLAHQAEAEGFDVYMMTPDKDYAQLVKEHVSIYHPGKKEIIGVAEVQEKFQIEKTIQVIDILGLMGDASDNIPGCPKVGEKTAIKLVQQFGSIDKLLANTHLLKGKQKETIENNSEQIRLSKTLATIILDVPISLDQQQLKRKDINEDALKALFLDLEFTSFLKRMNGASPKANETRQPNLFDLFEEAERQAEANTDKTSFDPNNQNYILIDNETACRELVQQLQASSSFCFDTETTGIEALNCELVGIAFSIKTHEAFYVPLPAQYEKAKEIIDIFKPALENTNSLKIGQNIKYDMLVLSNYEIEVKGPLFDTMVAHYLLQPEARHNLDSMAEIYLSYSPISIEQLIGKKGAKQGSMRDVAPEKICNYACEDADITLRLKEHFEPLITSQHLHQLFYEIEMPLVYVLVEMEKNGALIDTAALNAYAQELSANLETLQKKIIQQAPQPFNVDSPKQVGEILFGQMQLDAKAKKTKSGQFSTSEEVLQKLKNSHPIVADILEYRGLKKLLSTYVLALPELINKRTGRIHTSYNQTVVSTGRLSSTHPNLQNIPIRTEAGKEIRRCFIAKQEHLFLSADYSQIELRIMAHLSADPGMLEAFRNNIDIHRSTAAKIYQVSLDEVEEDMRRKAKTANFGIIYGISAFGLANRLNIPRQEAQMLIEGYFSSFPKVRTYMDEAIAGAKDQGYVETIWGRKRFLPDINSRNAIVRGIAERNAINAPIQGSAADIIKIAMINVLKQLKEHQLKTKLILQVHDELNFEVPVEELEQVKHIVHDAMQHACQLSIPLEVSMGWGTNWLLAH